MINQMMEKMTGQMIERGDDRENFHAMNFAALSYDQSDADQVTTMHVNSGVCIRPRARRADQLVRIAGQRYLLNNHTIMIGNCLVY
jgi:hypothetical protein